MDIKKKKPNKFSSIYHHSVNIMWINDILYE